ncbi:MAG: hypothetical protein RLY40_428, partial [Pseudomonadota bacterium]
MRKNISTTYEKLKTTWTLVQTDLDKRLPKLSGEEFLEAFGDEFQDQLSEQGKREFPQFKQTILNSTQEKFDAAKEAREKIYNETTDEFLSKFDLDETLQNAQSKLNKNKENLLKNLNALLIANSQDFTNDDKNNLQKAFTKKLSEDYDKLNNHLEEYKSLVTSTFAKLKLHLDTQTRNQDKANDFTIEQIPKLEELKIPNKPKPKNGYVVDTNNIKKQTLNDIANGKEITIKITDTQNYSHFKKISDIGFQHQSPGLALFHIIILFFVKRMIPYICSNNVERIEKAIQELIKEGHLIDPKKIKLKVVNLSNEKEIVVREEGPLDEKTINKLQSLNSENK